MIQGLPQGASQIAQGATFTIFNRKDMTVKTATVVNVSQPHVSKAAQNNPMLAFQGLVVDITLTGESQPYEFPTNGATSANYSDRGIFLSLDNDAVTKEIEAMENASRMYMAQTPWHQMVLEKSGPLKLELNPKQKAELEQAQKITSLEGQLAAMSGKVDQLVSLLSAVNPANQTKEE